MNDNKVQIFLNKDTEQMVFFFDRPLQLFETSWNPNNDKEITIEHLLRFMEKDVLSNFNLANFLLKQKLREKIEKEGQYYEEPTELGEELMIYRHRVFYHFIRVRNLYRNGEKTDLWLPKCFKLTLQPGYVKKIGPEYSKYEFLETINVYDASKIYDRFKNVLKDETEKDKKIKLRYLLWTAFYCLRFFYENVGDLSCGPMFYFSTKEKENIIKQMNLIPWEDESYKLCMKLIEGEKQEILEKKKKDLIPKVFDKTGDLDQLDWNFGPGMKEFLETPLSEEAYKKEPRVRETWCDKFLD